MFSRAKTRSSGFGEKQDFHTLAIKIRFYDLGEKTHFKVLVEKFIFIVLTKMIVQKLS